MKSDYQVRALAEEIIAGQPQLFDPADVDFVCAELVRRCQQIVQDRYNDIRMEVQARLIRKKRMGRPFTPAEVAEAELYPSMELGTVKL